MVESVMIIVMFVFLRIIFWFVMKLEKQVAVPQAIVGAVMSITVVMFVMIMYLPLSIQKRSLSAPFAM